MNDEPHQSGETRAVDNGGQTAAMSDTWDGYEAPEPRVMSENTTAGEAFAWHKADRPECPNEHLTMRRDGFGCQRCGWRLLDPELDPGEGSEPMCAACGHRRSVHPSAGCASCPGCRGFQPPPNARSDEP